MNQQGIPAKLPDIDSDQRQDAASPSSRACAWPVLALVLWFVAQFCLLHQHLQREVLWAFPGYWDQVRYLQESQQVFRGLVHKGLLRGLIHAVTTPTPTGNLLSTEAAVLYLFLGNSRLTALLVLFGHWIALQIVAVATIRWLSGRRSLAVIGLALLLLAACQLRKEGGLTDFRIDFAAYCTLAILICLVIRSNVFADRGMSLLAAAVASYLILLRYIMAVYLAAIGALLLLGTVVFWLLWWRRAGISRLAKTRMLNVLLFSAFISTVCLPAFWHSRKLINVYYVVGTAREKDIRAQEAGVRDRLDSLLFYPRAVWDEQAGPEFRRAAIALIVLSLLALGLRTRPRSVAGSSSLSDRLNMPLAYLLLLACILGPYLVLTTDRNKATYVGNVFMPPLWTMIMLAVVAAAESLRSRTHNLWLRHVPTGLAAVMFSMAVSYQVSSYGKQGRYTLAREDVRHALELHDVIGQKCQELGLQAPVIGVDFLSDAFFPDVVAVTQRERHQIMLAPRPAYRQAVSATSEADVMAGLQTADFVLLTLSDESADTPYPFDHALKAMQPQLLKYCDREMIPLRETSFFGRRVRLYMRPSLRVEPTYSDWIGEDGTTLYGDTAELRQFPSITLRGTTFGKVHFPDDGQTVAATLEIEGRQPLLVPATYADTNGQYTIHLSIPPLDTSNDGMVAIRLHFNRFFVPRELGVNGDTRHLVVNPPTSVNVGRP